MRRTKNTAVSARSVDYRATPGVKINGSRDNNCTLVANSPRRILRMPELFFFALRLARPPDGGGYSRIASLDRLGRLRPRARVHPTDRQAGEAGGKHRKCEHLMTGCTAGRTLLRVVTIAVVDSLICIRLVKGRSLRVLIAQILYVSPTAVAAACLHATRSHSFSPRRSIVILI